MLNIIKNILIFGALLVFTIWLSPLILIIVGIYLIYRVSKAVLRKKLIKQIEREWFPKGKYIFFLYSDSKKWKDYFETELIPKIKDKAMIWNWSTRQKDGWSKHCIESKILSLFRPIGYFYPIAIVFLPSGEIKTFQFYTPYVNMLKSGKDDYKKLEQKFLKLVNSL